MTKSTVTAQPGANTSRWVSGLSGPYYKHKLREWVAPKLHVTIEIALLFVLVAFAMEWLTIEQTGSQETRTMSIKRILLPVSKQYDIAKVAGFAFALAGQHRAEVQGFYPQRHEWSDDWLDNWGLSEGEIAALEEKAKKNAFETERLAREVFEAQAKCHQKVKASFLSTFDRSTNSLLDYAVFADLTVLGATAISESRFWQYLLNQMLTQSTRPVFVAPPRPVDKDLGNRIVIAWNQSPAASRAIAAAMPLIEKASHVVIVSVGSKGDRHSVDGLHNFVSLHARDVDIAIIDPKGRKTGHMLIDKTAEIAGSILVMGAYSHRRWREQVFGGVTEYVLNNTDVPALMMH
ncbi:MAG: universal stress protein [Hyphomicrobiales bacterium]|nr:universal stress protein [Hyphomicrobiales bacterium]MCP4999020.1 universal stress protein [Hyphomicrobiales bacterium]